MAPTDKQLQYIDAICCVLDMAVPKLKTKAEARDWLSVYVPKYKAQLELENELALIASGHENAGDRA